MVSFYKSDDASKQMDGLMEKAKSYLDERIESGEWSDRNISWFRADIEKHTELIDAEETDFNQMVSSKKTNFSRYLNYGLADGETEEEAIESLALIILELTGDWYKEIDCD